MSDLSLYSSIPPNEIDATNLMKLAGRIIAPSLDEEGGLHPSSRIRTIASYGNDHHQHFHKFPGMEFSITCSWFLSFSIEELSAMTIPIQKAYGCAATEAYGSGSNLRQSAYSASPSNSGVNRHIWC